MISIFQKLILFCTETNNDTISIKHRQKVIRERKVMETTLSILKMLSHVVKSNDANSPYYKLMKLAYQFIEMCCKDNTTNGLHLYDYIGFLQSQVFTVT